MGPLLAYFAAVYPRQRRTTISADEGRSRLEVGSDVGKFHAQDTSRNNEVIQSHRGSFITVLLGTAVSRCRRRLVPAPSRTSPSGGTLARPSAGLRKQADLFSLPMVTMSLSVFSTTKETAGATKAGKGVALGSRQVTWESGRWLVNRASVKAHSERYRYQSPGRTALGFFWRSGFPAFHDFS